LVQGKIKCHLKLTAFETVAFKGCHVFILFLIPLDFVIMENAKAFQERNLIGICEYINKYCEIYINNVPILSGGNVKAFHTFFPTLLVCIFGAPTKR
jgi:hypothetical protein